MTSRKRTKMRTDPRQRRRVLPRKKQPGRKSGKHSSKEYTQTSIYLPIELKNKVRAKLYEKGMEMSGLVENMLRNWLEKQS